MTFLFINRVSNMEQEEKKPRKKTGGGSRKGIPNKVNAFTRAVIQELTSDYYQSGLMAEDIAQLAPKDRLQMHLELMKFVIAKPQSVDVNLKATVNAPNIEETLRRLALDNE